MSPRRLVDQAITSFAEVQHGVVARWQLIERGAGRRAIEHRVETGHLIPVHRGAYAVGHRRLSLRGEWMAAVLAGGHEAVLSHLSAASLWGLAGARRPVHITVPHSRRPRLPRVTVHRARSLHPIDRAVRDRIPVTSLARTLLDLAESLDQEALADALAAADRQHDLELSAFEALLERSPGRRAAALLSELLSTYRTDLDDQHSELERRFRRLCREHELPLPATNVWVENFLVDAFWPQHRLVVELDSYRFHRGRDAFERDRARDVELRLAGYTVLRFTWRQLCEGSAEVAAAIRSVLIADCSRPSGRAE